MADKPQDISARAEQEWNSLASRLGLEGNLSKNILNAIISNYTAPYRKYHNLDHIGSMLSLYKEYRHLADDPDWVELSIWFHDIIYTPGAPDNEEKSAGLAKKLLAGSGLPDIALLLIEEQILSTKHDKPAICYDSKLVSDLDIAELGAAYEKFTANRDLIWEESAHLGTPEWLRQGTIRFYMGMLSQRRIYETCLIEERFGKTARANLERGLGELMAGR